METQTKSVTRKLKKLSKVSYETDLTREVRKDYPNLDARIVFDSELHAWFLLKDYLREFNLEATPDMLAAIDGDNITLLNLTKEGKEVEFMFGGPSKLIYLINKAGIEQLTQKVLADNQRLSNVNVGTPSAEKIKVGEFPNEFETNDKEIHNKGFQELDPATCTPLEGKEDLGYSFFGQRTSGTLDIKVAEKIDEEGYIGIKIKLQS